MLRWPETAFHGSPSGVQRWDTWDASYFLNLERGHTYGLNKQEQAKVLLAGRNSRMPVATLEPLKHPVLLNINLSLPADEWHTPPLHLEAALVFAAFEEDLEDGSPGLGFLAVELFGTRAGESFRLGQKYMHASRETEPNLSIGQLISRETKHWSVYATNAALTAAGLAARTLCGAESK